MHIHIQEETYLAIEHKMCFYCFNSRFRYLILTGNDSTYNECTIFEGYNSYKLMVLKLKG